MSSRLAIATLFAVIFILLGFRDASARPERPSALDSARVTYIYDGPEVEFGSTNAEAEMEVPDLFLINDVDMLVQITHTWVGDVSLILESPNGQLVTLVSGAGGNGQNFRDTEFNDAAPSSIQNAAAPFTGSFRPMEPLSGFNGGAGIGRWILHLEDTFPSMDDGTLTGWELTLGDRIGGTVRGIVTSFAITEPLEGVTIELLDTPYSTSTDAFGRYLLVAQEGDYDMLISYPGWCEERFDALEFTDYDTLDVNAALRNPEFNISVSSLSLMVVVNQTDSATFLVANDGNCGLEWSSEIAESWLSIDPANGNLAAGEELEIEFKIDASGRNVGDYYSEIAITHNAVHSPVIIPVLMTSVEDMNAIPQDAASPSDYALIGSFPNPFNGSTTLRFALPQISTVRLNIYTSDGRLARQIPAQTFTTGIHDVQLDLHDLASGVYFASLTAGDFTKTQKLILIK
jgi:subtilisin-like proprotein convertase family protein